MPELPEVETTVVGLQKTIVGQTIVDLWSNSFSVAYVNKNNHKNKSYFKKLRNDVLGKNIEGVSRRGKHILIELTSAKTLVIHMKMTGHLLCGKYTLANEEADSWPWIPEGKDTPLHDLYNRHIRAVFTLENKMGEKKHLVFCDPRKFGTIELFRNDELHTKLGKLGPEPLGTNFTLSLFEKILAKKRGGVIKTALLDQELLVGVGNIYSDEALHLSHIHPLRDVLSLTENEKALLHQSIQKVLRNGIDFGGDSMSDYRNVDGERGNFQGKHLVYLRQGKPCLTKDCPSLIQKKKVGSRSSHFCAVCQK
jgi:formamidopyrimidine-DNA glycosylase